MTNACTRRPIGAPRRTHHVPAWRTPRSRCEPHCCSRRTGRQTIPPPRIRGGPRGFRTRSPCEWVLYDIDDPNGDSYRTESEGRILTCHGGRGLPSVRPVRLRGAFPPNSRRFERQPRNPPVRIRPSRSRERGDSRRGRTPDVAPTSRYVSPPGRDAIIARVGG